MENQFKALGVSDEIIQGITEMGFEEPTIVQKESIPFILSKKDLIVRSKTGSGKTGAFGMPITQRVNPQVKDVQALILSPTRELAVQVDKEIRMMAKATKVSTTAVYGQHNIQTEIEQLKKGVHIVTGTPGRVFDHMERGTLKTEHIEFLVLDEGDRMLDMGFYDQIVKIIKHLPTKRTTLLFSATMPAEIQKICRKYMDNPLTIELESETKTVDTIEQIYYRVEKNEKRKQLSRIIRAENPTGVIVFCNMRREVDRVKQYLANGGFNVEALHGAISQNKRLKTIQKLKKGKIQVLVATDVAARGIHVDELSHVINYDIPVEKDSYVHRIGRTGRAGNSGKAISLVTADDVMSLYEIEEHVGRLIEESELPVHVPALPGANKTHKTAKPKSAPKHQHMPKHQHTSKPQQTSHAVKKRVPEISVEIVHKKKTQSTHNEGTEANTVKASTQKLSWLQRVKHFLKKA
ncbi:DEAD/DEAH box helicase [Vallitaleaceae bacterium 9-2]